MDLIRGFDPDSVAALVYFQAVPLAGAEHISAPSIGESRVTGMHFCRGGEVARKPNKQQVYLPSLGAWKLELSGRNTLQWEPLHLVIPG